MIRIMLALLLALGLTASNIATHARRLQARPILHQDNQNCTLPSSTGNNTILLGSCPQQIYLLPMAIGSPSQNLSCIVDTGQPFMEILTTPSNPQCFTVGKSTSVDLSGQYTDIQLGNGQQVTAELASDFVGFSNTTQSTRTDMLLVSSSVQNQYPQVIAGVVGLGLNYQGVNFLSSAYQSGTIGTDTYTLSLNLNSSSYLYYNSLPQEIVNQSIFIRSKSDEYYSLRIIGLSVGGVQYTNGAAEQAVITSGNSYFYLNEKVYNAVVNRYFSGCQKSTEGPVCSCQDVQNWPTFSFMFQGAEVYITGDSYLAYLQNGSCTYGFGYIENQKDVMILGTSFFLNYNLTFNPSQAKIGMQGNLLPVQVIDFPYFIALQIVFLILMIGLGAVAGALLWILRVVDKQRPSRSIQFSISDRFIETE